MTLLPKDKDKGQDVKRLTSDLAHNSALEQSKAKKENKKLTTIVFKQREPLVQSLDQKSHIDEHAELTSELIVSQKTAQRERKDADDKQDGE